MKDSWQKFISGLEEAGKLVDESKPETYRAIVRALTANLDILELDPAFPQFVDSNQFNHKWFLDVPDGYYLQTSLCEDYEYLLQGNLGDAAYTSFTLYEESKGGLNTKSLATLLDKDLKLDADNNFEILFAKENHSGVANFIKLEENTGLFWVRQLFDDIKHEKKGSFRINRINTDEKPLAFPEEQYARGLRRLGKMIPMLTQMTGFAYANQLKKTEANSVRVWEEMQGGAVFTSDDTFYQIGRWDLKDDETLVLKGKMPNCRFWSIVLYSELLNSLDNEYRMTSLTRKNVTLNEQGEFEITLSARVDSENELDTEGRKEGLFVIRTVGFDKTEEILLPETEVRRKA